MRAREFIAEQKDLPPETKDPLQHAYTIPGLPSSNPYNQYRFGVAIARARSDVGTDGLNADMPAWSAETPFGQEAIVVGMNGGIADVIDKALAMTKTPGGKKLVSTADSTEPALVDTTSPVKAFKGYPR